MKVTKFIFLLQMHLHLQCNTDICYCIKTSTQLNQWSSKQHYMIAVEILFYYTEHTHKSLLLEAVNGRGCGKPQGQNKHYMSTVWPWPWAFCVTWSICATAKLVRLVLHSTVNSFWVSSVISSAEESKLFSSSSKISKHLILQCRTVYFFYLALY